MYLDPQKLPGVIPGNAHRPIPVLSSPNHTQEVTAKETHPKHPKRERESSGFFAWLLPRPFRRAMETLFGGRRRGELSGTVGDAEFFGPHRALGEVWDDEMSSSMLGKRLRKVVQNYQVRGIEKRERVQLAHSVYYFNRTFPKRNLKPIRILKECQCHAGKCFCRGRSAKIAYKAAFSL